ncbi:MAG: branched-chain amino acid ABC transporter permease [Acidimicrobiia bacterium]
MRGRPLLYTSYEADQAIFPTGTQKLALAALLVLMLLIPLQVIPGLSFLGEDEWLNVLVRAMIFCIGALGLTLLTGLAGQVSLGHAFFMGVGAYTAVILGGQGTDSLWGLGLPIWIWLPAAGLVPALIGAIIAPAALRVRGLYLAFVTLGLVFIGEHFFRTLGFITGGPGLGRDWPDLAVRVWKEEEALIDFSTEGTWLGIELSARAKAFYPILLLLILFALVAKNLSRTRLGRAFMAIRDRDIAAEIMGVSEARHKAVAFAMSSFFAGVAGALLASFFRIIIPEFWNLFLSVQMIAIILIGGASLTTGAILGSAFLIGLPKVVEELTEFLVGQVNEGGPLKPIADLLITQGDDFGLISLQPGGSGLSLFQLNIALYGLFIILFLIFEPLGLFGIWIRIRNYFKAWPFSY